MRAQRDSERRGENNNLVLGQLCGVRMVGPGVMSDRRGRVERRSLSLWSVIYGGFRPRRRDIRRTNDGSVPVVDLHEKHLLVVAIGILLLCCSDAFLTLTLLTKGAHEANPVMASLIYTDVTMFASVKMGLTGMGVLVLVLLSRHRLFGRFPVVSALYLALAAYGVLVIYEIGLLLHLTLVAPT